MSNIEEIENYNTFTQRVMKQIVSKDDEETRKLLIKYAKEKYPKDEVRIDFYDEEIVKKIISLGITEYIKTQNDLYKIMVLGEFNTTTNNIEEDIKRLEKLIIDANVEDMDMNNCFCGEHIESIENLLKEHKKNKNALELLNGMKKKYKIALFMIIRNSIVMPTGKMLGKTEKEINKMSYETLCEVITMTDFKIAEKMYEEGKEK